jgi:hypothetical protein
MMSIPYPPDFDIDFHADWRAQREEAILRGLDIGAVLAEVDSLIASEPDAEDHPLHDTVAVMLNQKASADITALYHDLKRLCAVAVNRLVDEAMLQD